MIGYDGHDEQVSRDNDDDNVDGCNCACNFCDDSACNYHVHDSDDTDDYDALVDEGWQVLLMIKTADQSKRI